MSVDIWRDCQAERRLRRVSTRPYRVVEAQHITATRKLVDSEEEHRLLEGLIDSAKPRAPASRAGLHYLLSTPFRYAPLRHGSRFGSRFERGIWYGSKTARTAFAESAYYRLLFFQASAASLLPHAIELSLFRASAKARRGLDLTQPPFVSHRALLTSKTSYVATQALGLSARAAGVDLILYESARDGQRGVNVALLDPSAFSSNTPEVPETWTMTLSIEQVEVAHKSFFVPRVLRFRRSDFFVHGKLPSPAV